MLSQHLLYVSYLLVECTNLRIESQEIAWELALENKGACKRRGSHSDSR